MARFFAEDYEFMLLEPSHAGGGFSVFRTLDGGSTGMTMIEYQTPEEAAALILLLRAIQASGLPDNASKLLHFKAATDEVFTQMEADHHEP